MERVRYGKLFIIIWGVWFLIVAGVVPVYAQNTVHELQAAADRLGGRLFWDPLSGTGVIEKDGHSISFRLGDQVVLLDYRKFAIITAPVRSGSKVLVSDDFIETAAGLFDSGEAQEYYRIGAVLIDPGHGGKDPGANAVHSVNGRSVSVVEKDIALSVSQKLLSMLKKTYPDKNIFMTRNDDSFLSLEKRVEIANSVHLEPHEAILYISIHVNASLDPRAKGFEVWYLSPGYRRTVLEEQDGIDTDLLPILNSMLEEEYTTESVLIAKFILDGLAQSVGSQSPSRGLKEEEWFVVKNANMPSVLVELGFLTNGEEAALLSDQDYLRKLAEGIYNGLISFIGHFERSRGFTGTS